MKDKEDGRLKVDIVLSPYGTSIHFAAAPMAERYKVPIVGSTAASVKLRDFKTKYFWFITSALPDRQMAALVDLLQNLGEKRLRSFMPRNCSRGKTCSFWSL